MSDLLSSMSFWVWVSWIMVAVLTGINIWVFLKLKKASDQMMKMAFPQSKNMADAMGQMQAMMGSLGGMGGMGGRPGAGGPQISQQQMKMAMDMLAGMTGKPPAKNVGKQPRR